jgi:ribosomal protein S3
VIGKQGASVDALRDELERISGKKVRVTIHEIKTPELDAALVAENVASQLEKRIAFRRALKQTLMRSMRAGARGVKIQVSGRLGGSEMSRREWDRDGRVPLHTLRANVDYGQAEARTTFGRIGVQAWLYLGDFVTATGDPVPPPGREAPEPAPRPAAPTQRTVVIPAREELAPPGADEQPALDAPVAERDGAPVAESLPEGEEAEVEAAVEVDEDVDVDGDADSGEKVEKLCAKRATARRKPVVARKPAAPPRTVKKPVVRKPAAAPQAEPEEE